MVITCCSSLQFFLTSHGSTAREVSLKFVYQGISTEKSFPELMLNAKFLVLQVSWGVSSLTG